MLINIVEDDKNIAEIEEYALKNSGYEVVLYDSAEPFYNAIKTTIPDLCILDIMLPGDDGITILKKLKSNIETKNVPVILITAKVNEIDKVKGLDAGADDYIGKPFGVMELISRVKAVLRRASNNEVKEESIIESDSIVMLDSKHKVMIAGSEISITYKEYELLKCLIQNKGIVLTRDKLMEKVWGFDFQGESRTVDMHIKTLRQKLGEEGSRIKTIRNVGYILE